MRTGALIDDPATVRPPRDDASERSHAVTKFGTDRQQARTVIAARNDPNVAELASEDLKLKLEESDVGIAPRGAVFDR